MEHDCFICRKHAGKEIQPPGGYLLITTDWRVCHAPANSVPAGTVFVGLERHAIGLADLTIEEAAQLGPLLRQVSIALQSVTKAERIYTVMTVERAPHAHLWLVPRPAEATTRGLAYLSQDIQCSEDEALAMAQQLRAALNG